LANADISVIDPATDTVLLTADKADGLGQFSVAPPADTVWPGVIRIRATVAAGALETLVSAEPGSWRIKATTGLKIDLAATIVSRLMGAKLMEAKLSDPGGYGLFWPNSPYYQAYNAVRAMTATIATALRSNAAGPLGVAVAAARQAPTGSAIETLAHAVANAPSLRDSILVTVGSINQTIANQIRAGGRPVQPADWSFGGTTIAAPRVQVEGQVVTVTDGTSTTSQTIGVPIPGATPPPPVRDQAGGRTICGPQFCTFIPDKAPVPQPVPSTVSTQPSQRPLGSGGGGGGSGSVTPIPTPIPTPTPEILFSGRARR